MTKLMIIKNNQVSVTEEKKGKQIAVKENNITSLKKFYKDNYQANIPNPVEEAKSEPIDNTAPVVNVEQSNEEVQLENNTPNQNSISEEPATIINPSPIELNPVDIAVPEIDTPSTPKSNGEEAALEPVNQENNEDTTGNNDTPVINLVPESNIQEDIIEEEMDPELKEIKERLDKVIIDLNNYKKKIKLLEQEVNQNLEKSREVLKDTQAAAQIMSIQQERQRKINEEVGGGENPENDAARTLQKNT